MGNEKKSAKLKSQLGQVGAFIEPAEEVTEAQETAPEQKAQEQATVKEQLPTPPTEALLAALQALQAEVRELREEKAEKQNAERKTKRVNLLTKPSVFAKATEAAKKEQVSFNEFAERALLAYAEKVLGK
jgi:hypothetical protein